MDLGTGHTSRVRIDALTGLRFFAALAVVLFHVVPDHAPGLPRPVANVIGAGYVAVTLFFVLSGYILAYNYAPDDRARTLNRRSFWGARAARIYPVYALSILLTLPRFIQLQLSTPASPAARLIDTGRIFGASMLMIQAWIPSLAYRLNWPSWSLSVEAFFYALFPLLVLTLRKDAVRRHPVLTCALLWVASLGAVTELQAFARTPMGAGLLSRDEWFSLLIYNPVLHLPEFVAGMVLGIAYPAGTNRISPRAAQTLTVVSLVALLALLANAPVFPHVLLRTGLLIPLFGALVVGLAMGHGSVAHFLSRPTLILLGEASYGIYILHTPIHGWMRGADMVTGSHLYTSPLWVPVYLTVTIVTCVWVLRNFEIPARRVVRSWFAERDPALAPTRAGESPAEVLPM